MAREEKRGGGRMRSIGKGKINKGRGLEIRKCLATKEGENEIIWEKDKETRGRVTGRGEKRRAKRKGCIGKNRRGWIVRKGKRLKIPYRMRENTKTVKKRRDVKKKLRYLNV